jgi:D-3-phosphoglycerate dehydrogenase
MGMRVIFYDVINKLPLGNARVSDSLQDLLKTAEFVTLHVPGLPETEKLIGEKVLLFILCLAFSVLCLLFSFLCRFFLQEIAMMKKGSFLLNASRGNVVRILSTLSLSLSLCALCFVMIPFLLSSVVSQVDIDAAVAALKSGHLAGGAFDVFPYEPSGKNEEFKSPLRGLSNVFLTPHVGSFFS